MSQDITRRHAVTLMAGAAALAGCSATGPKAMESVASTPSLDALARQKGLRFGTAMSARQLGDPRYVDIVLRDCGSIVAENEHKTYSLMRAPGIWTFEDADALAGFARSNDLLMRGHTLIWARREYTPQWLNETEFSAAEAAEWLEMYVGTVARRYAPQIHSWDVVNEAIDPKTGEIRSTPYTDAMGFDAIAHCFRIAAQAAPNATLAYNDYMSWETGNETHRAGVLRLLERLKKADVRLDALGIQSHSNYDMPNEFSAAKQKAWRGFVEEVIGMGLDIYITEYDVNDTRLAPDVDMRDRLIAAYTKDYFDLMLSYPQTKDILAWGMVDKDNWLQGFLPRTDGVEKRPTFYDSQYRPKMMREALAAALREAPARG